MAKIDKLTFVTIISLLMVLSGGIFVHADVIDITKALTCLNDSSPRIRCNMAYHLGEKGDTACVIPLLGRLSDKNHHVRRIAAHALGKLGDQRAVMPLIELVKDQSQPTCVRCSAAFALGRLGDPRASQVLAQLVREERGRLQASAFKGLDRLAETGTMAKFKQ